MRKPTRRKLKPAQSGASPTNTMPLESAAKFTGTGIESRREAVYKIP